MNKNRYIFIQLFDYISRYQFDKCVKKYNWNNRVRNLSCWEQFLAMSFWQITYRESLRDVIICLKSQKEKLYHLWFSNEIFLPTLAKANENRNYKIYEDFAMILIEKSRKLYSWKTEIFPEIISDIYALDASTIDLCLNIFNWASFRENKGAIKLHTLLDLRWNIPTFIHISDWKLHDVNALDLVKIKPWAFYIMDRWYFDFERLFKIDTDKWFFVTRLKINTKWKRIYSNIYEENTWIKCDQIIKFSSQKWLKFYPKKLRRIKYYDKKTDKLYEFITNNFTLPAKTIADLYKSRWEVELFFKWIKQHLKIKKFWGTSQNAVKTQIWISICSYLIILIIKKELNISQSMYEILQILSINSLSKIPLNSLFEKMNYKYKSNILKKQLKLAII